MSHVVLKVLTGLTIHNLVETFDQFYRMSLPPHEIAIVFKMILITFIDITDKDRNITRKDLESCYNKYRVHRCSDKIGNSNCTKDTVTTNLHFFNQAL